MTTKKFCGESPYKLGKTPPPESDFIFNEFAKKVSLDTSDRHKKSPLVAAIFGLGCAGSIHLSNIIRNPRIILKYIVEDREELFEKIRIFWHLEENVTLITSKDSERVYQDPNVNIVFITSPTHTHQDIVVNAIENNKDVFCAKPIAESIEEAKKCYNIAKSKRRILYAGFNRRFDPSERNLMMKVREGAVGHVQILKVTARDSPLPSIEYLKNSGGVFHDCLVHNFDMACWVLGELPVKVQASATALIPEIKAIDDFDTMAYLLTFPSGAIAIGDNSRHSAYGYDQRLEVFGNKGMIKVDNEKPAASTDYVIGQEGCRTNPIYYSFPSRYKLSYEHELEHFLDVVQNGVPQEVTSWQTLAITKIATAAEESARTQKTVELDWSKDDIPENYS